MTHETSTFYGQPTISPLSFASPGGFGNPMGQLGQSLWPLLGGSLAYSQMHGHLGGGMAPFGNPLQQLGAGVPPFGGLPHSLGSPFQQYSLGQHPFQQYGQLAGQGIGGWLAPQPFGLNPLAIAQHALAGPFQQYGQLAGQYGQLAGQGIGSWFGQPQLAQLGRILPLEIGPMLVVPTPYGLLAQPIAGGQGTFPGAPFGQQRGAGNFLPLQAMPQLACAM